MISLILFVAKNTDSIHTIKQAADDGIKAVERFSPLSILGDFFARFESCDYQYFVFCTPRAAPGPALEFGNNQFAGILSILAQSPDAIIHLIYQKYHEGPFPLVLQVVFVLACLAIIIRSADKHGLSGFYMSIVAAPLGVSFGFLVVQYLLIALGVALSFALQGLLTIAGSTLLIAILTVLWTGAPVVQWFGKIGAKPAKEPES